MKKAFLIILVVSAVILNAAFAQEPGIPRVMLSNKPGWHKIGEVKANFKTENESITILGKDVFKSILLKVTDAPITIHNVQVFYESGEMEDLDVDHELQPGTETRVIDLKYPNYEIDKVVFTYKTLRNSKGDKAHVELYGYKP